MWCCHCQQDVAAMPQTKPGRPACAKCGAYLDDGAELAQAYAHPSDLGVSLDAADHRADLTPPINATERERTHWHLRRIGRQLRTGYRHHEPAFSLSRPQPTWGVEALGWLDKEEQLRHVQHRVRRDEPPTVASTISTRLIALLLAAGMIGFVGGGGLLLWAAAFQLPQPWQWGLSTTIAAEGVLILALTWIAVRLWGNSRRVGRQLAGVDRQLHELEDVAGSLSGSHLAASQHYYSHFNQAASSHMLLANLRGQVDQLAQRMAND